MHRCRPAVFAFCLAVYLVLGGYGSPAVAGTIEVIAAQTLDFGAMVVLGNGTKQVAPDGLVSATGLAAVPGFREGPAEFVLRYRPDGPARSALLLISLNAAGSQTVAGTTGRLSGLVTDLPGIGGAPATSLRTLRLPPCSAALCETRFRVGGTLTLTGGAKQAAFSFPLQVTARLLAEL